MREVDAAFLQGANAAEEVKKAVRDACINAWSYRVDMVGTAVVGCRGFLREWV